MGYLGTFEYKVADLKNDVAFCFGCDENRMASDFFCSVNGQAVCTECGCTALKAGRLPCPEGYHTFRVNPQTLNSYCVSCGVVCE